MGNDVKVEKAENSNIVGGNVTGNVTTNTASASNESGIKTNDIVEGLEKSSSKTGIVLATVFVLALIILFVLTR